MSRRASRACLAAAAATLVASPPALATFPGENGAIAFSRGGDIWVINPDGTGETRLTSGAEHDDRAPEWSPDGAELMFQRTGPEGLPHVYRIRADGSGLTWVGPGLSPQFSADGRRIAFGGAVGAGLFVADRDGSDVTGGREVFPDLPDDPLPTDWSPINDLILWWTHNNHSFLGGISPDGARLGFALHEHPAALSHSEPEWSPDGTRIALSTEYSGESPCLGDPNEPGCPDPDIGITIMHLGGDRRVVHPSGRTPAWSPDGTRIVFADGQYPDGTIRVVGADGARPRMITTGSEPDWQPRPVLPRPAETRSVTVTVQAPAPPPVVVETVVTRIVRGPGEPCVIPAQRRRLTLTIRARRAIRKGAAVRVGLRLDGPEVTVTRRRGAAVRATVR